MNLPIAPGPLPANPFVSICMPNYNYAALLPDAVASVQAQTYPHWELIICDDGSTDRSPELITHLAKSEPRLRPVLLAQNAGMAAALNACFDASHGELISFLDSDDTWLPRKLEILLNGARCSPHAGLLLHPLMVVDHRSRPLGLSPHHALQSGWHGPAMAARGEPCPSPPTSGIALRRVVAEQIFPLPKAFRTCADQAIFLSAAALTPIAALSTAPLGCLRIHGGNVTSGPPRDLAKIGRDMALQKQCFQLAASKSRLPGPWPLPWPYVAFEALSKRHTGDFNRRTYRQNLRACPSWYSLGPLRRLVFLWAPVLPTRLLFSILAIPAKLRSARACLARLRPAQKAGPGPICA